MTASRCQLLPLCAIALLPACSSPGFYGTIETRASTAPPTPDPSDNTLDSFDDIAIEVTDPDGNVAGGQQIGPEGGAFSFDVDAAGDYTIEITAEHQLLPGTSILPEVLGEMKAGPFHINGPTDVGTVTLVWQPEY